MWSITHEPHWGDVANSDFPARKQREYGFSLYYLTNENTLHGCMRFDLTADGVIHFEWCGDERDVEDAIRSFMAKLSSPEYDFTPETTLATRCHIDIDADMDSELKRLNLLMHKLGFEASAVEFLYTNSYAIRMQRALGLPAVAR